jgi:predicted small lipoprotein YifL
MRARLRPLACLALALLLAACGQVGPLYQPTADPPPRERPPAQAPERDADSGGARR